MVKEALTPIAKRLRKDSTLVERKLWHFLRSKQFEGFKFRRQEPIGSYVVDFVAYASKVIVELDGGQHAINAAEDLTRDRWLMDQGFNVLRFWDNEVLTNLGGVLEIIHKACLHE